MKRLQRSASLLAVLAVTGAVAACATPAGAGSTPDAPVGASLGSLDPGLPDGEVVAQGTVLEDADGTRLCFAVMESYPPQCQGIPLSGWTWDGVEGAETANGVSWGAYAVQGVYDGETITVTQPAVLLALYDPMIPDDPTDGVPGAADEATLLEIQEELPDRLGDALIGSWPQDGRLWAQVVWDDGTWQDAADGDYGRDVVLIQPLLREIDGATRD